MISNDDRSKHCICVTTTELRAKCCWRRKATRAIVTAAATISSSSGSILTTVAQWTQRSTRGRKEQHHTHILYNERTTGTAESTTGTLVNYSYEYSAYVIATHTRFSGAPSRKRAARRPRGVPRTRPAEAASTTGPRRRSGPGSCRPPIARSSARSAPTAPRGPPASRAGRSSRRAGRRFPADAGGELLLLQMLLLRAPAATRDSGVRTSRGV